jgi:hypothetical protein
MFNRRRAFFLRFLKEAEKHLPSPNEMTVKLEMWIVEDAVHHGGNA